MDQFSIEHLNGGLVGDESSQRNGSRDSLLLGAQLRIDGIGETLVRVRNLSSGGLMAEYAQPVMSGTPVQVEVRGMGWVAGRIAWAAEGRIGIAFDREVDPMAARKPVGNSRSASQSKPVKRAV